MAYLTKLLHGAESFLRS